MSLAEACEQWQTGRDVGSSLLRAGARLLTGVPHYFAADFISAHEVAASQDRNAMGWSAELLAAVARSEPADATGWSVACGLGESSFAGRGLGPKPQDQVIEAQLDRGELVMPLWGVSLDRGTADHYGTRFCFEIQGPFRAVAAWLESGIKSEEQELIAGGVYEVADVGRREGRTHVVLREAERPRMLPGLAISTAQ